MTPCSCANISVEQHPSLRTGGPSFSVIMTDQRWIIHPRALKYAITPRWLRIHLSGRLDDSAWKGFYQSWGTWCCAVVVCWDQRPEKLKEENIQTPQKAKFWSLTSSGSEWIFSKTQSIHPEEKSFPEEISRPGLLMSHYSVSAQTPGSPSSSWQTATSPSHFYRRLSPVQEGDSQMPNIPKSWDDWGKKPPDESCSNKCRYESPGTPDEMCLPLIILLLLLLLLSLRLESVEETSCKLWAMETTHSPLGSSRSIVFFFSSSHRFLRR